jgi:hypothetical protein
MNLNNNQFSNFLGKAVDRVARVGREVRDIPTAVGTVLDPRSKSRGLATKDIVNQLTDPIQAMGGQGQSSAWKNNVRPWTDSKTGKVTGSGFGMAKQDVTSYTKPYNQRNDAYESANIKADAAAVEKYKATKAPGWERG